MSKLGKTGGVLKATIGFLILVVVFLAGSAQAQSPDSFMVSNENVPPGGTATISVYLRNTQFSVSGFSARLILADSSYATIVGVDRGENVDSFEYFAQDISDGTCRVIGLVNIPGEGDPSPLSIGFHEIARIYVAISDDAPWGAIDSIFFANDDLPPERDNSISDSTGYINEIPSLVPGIILLDVFQGADDSPVGLPQNIELSQNYPNPFNANTLISFELSDRASDVSLRIYDLVGRLVKSFDMHDISAGSYGVTWNGVDNSGRAVTSGVYFYRLGIDSYPAKTMRMTLIK